MDDTLNLTLALAGTLYLGQFLQWRQYAQALLAGRIAAYRQSPAYGNQSLQNFFESFLSTWRKSTPPPNPEEYGLIALRPDNLNQSSFIDELLK